MKEEGKTGLVRCAYCGAERPVEEMEQGKIVCRNSRPDPLRPGRWIQFVGEKTNWYCKASDSRGLKCHSKDQMAHEG